MTNNNTHNLLTVDTLKAVFAAITSALAVLIVLFHLILASAGTLLAGSTHLINSVSGNLHFQAVFADLISF